MARHRAHLPSLLVLLLATALKGRCMPSFSNEALESARRELLRREVIGGISHYETNLRASGVTSSQGNEAIFGCASINITTLPATLLSMPRMPGYKIEIYAYVLSKFDQVTINPTWVAIARGAQYSPESTQILMNVSAVWKPSGYFTSPDVKQSFFIYQSFMDAAAFPTSGFGDKTHPNGVTLTTSLADAIPYLKLESSKHYVIMGTAAFPLGALRGQVQSWLNGLPKLCGIPK